MVQLKRILDNSTKKHSMFSVKIAKFHHFALNYRTLMGKITFIHTIYILGKLYF